MIIHFDDFEKKIEKPRSSSFPHAATPSPTKNTDAAP